MKIIRDSLESVFRQYIPLLNMHSFDVFVKNNNGNVGLVGLEIGTNHGFHAFNMLHNLSIKKLYLIDPYLLDGLYGNSEIRKKEAQRKLKKYMDKTVFVYKTSEEAVDIIPDNSIDFVYIDGNHDYEFVKRDIELYYPKVKDGGVFGGEDFSVRCLGVAKAVIEFVENNNLRLLRYTINF